VSYYDGISCSSPPVYTNGVDQQNTCEVHSATYLAYCNAAPVAAPIAEPTAPPQAVSTPVPPAAVPQAESPPVKSNTPIKKSHAASIGVNFVGVVVFGVVMFAL
jgi:hypothetical protein